MRRARGPRLPTGAAVLCGLAALLVVQPRSIAAAMVDLPFEHAFGGGAFARAGRLVGDLDGQGFGGLELQREAWSAADAAAFADLARADGFYRVRLLLPRAREHVLASLRARCLAASGFQERLTLHVGSDGSVTGLDYDTPPGACPPGLPLDERKLEASVPSAAALPVVVQPPASAPRILLDPYLNAAPGAAFGDTAAAGGGPGAGAPAGTQQQQQEQRQQQEKQAKKGKPAPPQDDRNFLQKNWIFMVPVGLLIFNMLGGFNAPEPNSGGGAAAGGATSGGAPRPPQ